MPDSVETPWKHPAPKVPICRYSGCYSASANAVFHVYRVVYRGCLPWAKNADSMDTAVDTGMDTSATHVLGGERGKQCNRHDQEQETRRSGWVLVVALLPCSFRPAQHQRGYRVASFYGVQEFEMCGKFRAWWKAKTQHGAGLGRFPTNRG